MYRIFILIFIVLAVSVQAQEIAPRGAFLNDSIKVGMPIQYTLAVSYPRQLDIVFPDSSFDFSPFEFDTKRFFPTKTDSLYSYDSAVYTLLSFEVDSVQYLRLPVFLVSTGDSIVFHTSTDSVILKHIVSAIPDTLTVENMPLKENTGYLPLALQFNYPYLIIGIILLVIICLLVMIIFGKRIKKWFRLRRMKRQYENFRSRYGEIVESKNEPDNKASKAVALWKNYMEQLSGYPYSKLTTKEIYAHEGHEGLRESLRLLDRVIYSGQRQRGDQLQAYDEIFSYTEKQYDNYVEGVKNE